MLHVRVQTHRTRRINRRDIRSDKILLCVILNLGEWMSQIEIKLPAVSHLVCTQNNFVAANIAAIILLRSVCSDP